MKHIPYIVLLLLSLTLPSCNDSDDSRNSSQTDCSTIAKNEFVYQKMTDTYLWYNEVPVLDPQQFSSPDAVLEASRYAAIDRWSFITSTEEFNNFFFTGEYIGIGLSHNEEGYIRYTFNNSPAAQAGITRGDRILAVNGTSVADIIAQNLWDTIFGPREAGVQVSLQIEKLATSSTESITLAKSTIVQNTVLHRSVIEHNSQKTAYLVFNSFTSLSYDELDSAFAYFKAQNANHLILDLRYNGGGLLDVARTLASLIAGPAYTNRIFFTLTHNDKYQDKNSNLRLVNEPNALSLNQLTVLTSGSTCSASEAVINGLNPLLNIKLIGDATCGKPVGMNNPEFCDIVLSHIEFKGTNELGYGDYYNGFAPDCNASDDAKNDFGDTNEALLREALYFMENQSCSPAAAMIHPSSKAKSMAAQPWRYDMYRNHQQ